MQKTPEQVWSSKGIKLAGVQNMILSLWQVPDKETAELMNLF